jgi:hypothetical protein
MRNENIPIIKMGVAHAFEQYVQLCYFNFGNQVGQSVERPSFAWAATHRHFWTQNFSLFYAQFLRKAYVDNED